MLPMTIRTRIALVLAAASLASAPLAAQQTLTAGQTVAGSLDSGDGTTADGQHYDVYRIRGRPGTRMIVTMHSTDFDPYLRWGSPAGSAWQEELSDDDGGPGLDARLAIVLGSGGQYELRASSLHPEQVGLYELRVTEPGPPPPATSLRVGQTVEGELTESDYEGDDGYEDRYAIRGAPAEIITLSLKSAAFDPFLRFGVMEGGELMNVTEDDDGGPGFNAEMVVQLTSAGVHHVVVRALNGGAAGAYTLRVLEGNVPEGDDDGFMTDTTGVASDTVTWVSSDSVVMYVDTVITTTLEVMDTTGFNALMPGYPESGTLDEDDQQTEDGAFFAEYAVFGSAGYRLPIRARSDDMALVVSIGLGNGRLFRPMEQAQAAAGREAVLRFDVPQEGMYTIRVAAARRGQRGEYTVWQEEPD